MITPTQFRLSPDTLEQLDRIARAWGLLRLDGQPNRSQTVRELARRQVEKILKKKDQRD